MSSANLPNTSTPVQNFVFDPLVLNSIRIVNMCVLAEIIGLFGISANILNIYIFKNLGYQDGVNVTLTALAVSDIGALVFLQLFNILTLPLIHEFDLFTSKSNLETMIHYVIGYFIRVSGFITSFAAFERCLCVVLPLKVKTVITNRVAVVVNISIFVVLSMYMFPPYYSIYFDYKFLPAYNKSTLYLYYKPYGGRVLKISYIIADLVLPYITFLILILCSSIIYVKIKSKAKWRNSISIVGQRNSAKEVKSGVMLMTVSMIFVLLLLPDAALTTTAAFIRELSIYGAYNDVTNLITTFTTLLGNINCSMTIFVYYNMSSKYRLVFKDMLVKCKLKLSFERC